MRQIDNPPIEDDEAWQVAYTDWCERNGLDPDDDENSDAYERLCDMIAHG